MMHWDEAAEFVSRRSVAIMGDTSGEPVPPAGLVRSAPEMVARKLLSGVLDGKALEDALMGLTAATNATAIAFTMNMHDLVDEREDGASPSGSLYVALAQVLLQGCLLKSGPRGDGASQTPSSDFPGATE